MAESLRIEATEDTPLIDFDMETGVFKVTGRALPEDAHEFFKPIEEWVQDYVESPLETTTVEMRIDYFNSAATRYIFNLLMCFEDIVDDGGDVKVVWFYKEGDDMIESKGEELSSILELPFEMKTL
ncbi:MAG: DUF1987 domain-containing protein [Flavobacteriales bacterium]|nr:DUF1987 domain-containing protein [Flavobacteriales bacterium]